MKLTVFDLKRFSLAQNDKVTSDDLKMIEKKSGEKDRCTCYGIVTDKTVRCAEVHGRGSVYVPFENTEAEGTYKHKYTLFRTICDYYFCTVEINGEVFENICCYNKDFLRINIGDRVVIALEDSYNLPVIYSSGSR